MFSAIFRADFDGANNTLVDVLASQNFSILPSRSVAPLRSVARPVPAMLPRAQRLYPWAWSGSLRDNPRNDESERGSLSGRWLNRDGSLERRRDQIANDRQAKTGASDRPAGRVEGLEHAGESLCFNAAAEITYLNREERLLTVQTLAHDNLDAPTHAARIRVALRV